MERVKSIFLLGLILCAIYQLLGIWNFTPNEKGVLGNLFNNTQSSYENEYYLKPEKVIASFGNEKYAVIKATRLESNLINDYIEKVYDNVFKRRENLEETKIDIKELYNKKSIILEYNLSYDEEEFKEIFKIKSDKFVREIKNIKRLIIIPIISGNSSLDVYLENSLGNIYYFKVDIDSTELYGLIDEINMFNQYNIYVLSENEVISKLFDDLTLLPVIINDTSFMKRKANIINPFLEEENIETYANIFFENPKAKWKMQKDENIIIYGDGEKSVRIYSDGYIEYVHNAKESLEVFDLKDSIKSVEEFLQKEIYLTSENYIKKIEKLDDKKYKFYYSQRIDGFEQLMEKEIIDKFNLETPLEITVENGVVTNYRRIVQDIKFEQNLEEYQFVSYDEILDKVFSRFKDKKIDEMKIVYYKDSNKNEANLVWYVIVENNEVIYDAIRREE